MENIEIRLSKNEYGFKKILDDFKDTKYINIITFNFSKESYDLLSILKNLKNKEKIRIITNIPGRWECYRGDYFKKNAKIIINKYLKNLEPNSFSSPVEIYFNFENHAKIYSTDNYTYLGSQNFSDESKNNHEIGIIINNNIYEKNLGETFIEELIYNSEYKTIPFYGVEIEKLKSELKSKTIEIEKLINQFDYEIEICSSGINYLGEIKIKFKSLSEILDEIKIILDEMKTKTNNIKAKNIFEDNEFIIDTIYEIENTLSKIDQIMWEISPQGEFYEIYYDYEKVVMENVSDADEEHLQSAIDREMRKAFDNCDEIKDRYEEEINSFFSDFKEKILNFKELFNTIEEISSNKELIDNTNI